SSGGHHRDGGQFDLYATTHGGHRFDRPHRAGEFHPPQRAASGQQCQHHRHHHSREWHNRRRHHPYRYWHNHYRERHRHPLVQPGPSLFGGFFHHHPQRPAASRVERYQYQGVAIPATARRGQFEGDTEDRRPAAHRHGQFPAGHRRRRHQPAGQHAVHLHRCRRQRGNHSPGAR